MTEKLSHDELVKKATVSLQKKGFRGVHTVYSGFTEAFKKSFEGEILHLSAGSPGGRNADEALKALGLK